MVLFAPALLLLSGGAIAMFLWSWRAMSPPGSVRIGMAATVLTVAGVIVMLSPFGTALRSSTLD